MKSWVRLYTDVPSSRKAQSLTPVLFKFWINCLSFAGRSDTGALPSAEDMAWEIRESEANVNKWLGSLVDAKLIVETDGERFPNNWGTRQFEISSTTERTRAFRNRSRNKYGNGSGTNGNEEGTFPERSSRASESVSVLSLNSEYGSGAKKPKNRQQATDLTADELEATWERHHKHIRGESKNLTFARIFDMASTGKIELLRFRDVHPRYCAYWDVRDWNFGALSLLGWVEAGMPEPPPTKGGRKAMPGEPGPTSAPTPLTESAYRKLLIDAGESNEEIEKLIQKFSGESA